MDDYDFDAADAMNTANKAVNSFGKNGNLQEMKLYSR